MDGFFHAPGLHIRYWPDITGVLAAGVTAKLAAALTLVVAFTWILLRHADWVNVEVVVVTLRVPEDDFVAAAETAVSVGSAPKGPNESVAQSEVGRFGEDRVG